MASDQGGIESFKNGTLVSSTSSILDSIDKELLPIYLTPDFAPRDKYQTSFDVRKDWNSSPRSGPKIQFPPDFYVPPHPIAVATIPYGLFLVFAAWLAPQLIPQTWPLGGLAYYLGINYNGLVAFLSIFAGIVHLLDPIWVLYLAGTYGLDLATGVLWAINAFGFGIFGIWPLVFPDFWDSVKNQYCEYSPCDLKFQSKKYKRAN